MGYWPIISLLLIINGIYTDNKKLGLFLQKINSKKYINIILGLFGISISIIYGVLINTYKEYKYEREREIVTCTKLEDINSQEDIDAAFELKENLPDEQPTNIMIINTAFSVILGLCGLFLIIIGAKKFDFKNNKSTYKLPNIIINMPK